MSLTKLERLTLANQFEIRKLLKKSTEFDRTIEILTSGYECYYDSILDVMDDCLPEADCRFVIDVLQMYRMLEQYQRDEKDDELAALPYSHFYGFDGNGNGDDGLMAFARFDMQGGRWDEQKKWSTETDNFNSHAPMRAVYERMIGVWAAMGRKAKLSKAEARAIVDAASQHP